MKKIAFMFFVGVFLTLSITGCNNEKEIGKELTQTMIMDFFMGNEDAFYANAHDLLKAVMPHKKFKAERNRVLEQFGQIVNFAELEFENNEVGSIEYLQKVNCEKGTFYISVNWLTLDHPMSAIFFHCW